MVAMSVEDGTTSTVINEGDRDTIVKDAKFQERRQNRRRRDRARELIVLVVGFHHSRWVVQSIKNKSGGLRVIPIAHCFPDAFCAAFPWSFSK